MEYKKTDSMYVKYHSKFLKCDMDWSSNISKEGGGCSCLAGFRKAF